MTATDWFLLAGLSMLWGGSFFFTELAVEAFGPLTIVAGRLIIGALTLHLAIRLLRIPLPRLPGFWIGVAALAVLNNVLPFTAIAWGQTGITAGLASVLNATTPLFTVLVMHVASTDDRLTPARIVGVMVGLAGVAVLVGPSAFRGLDGALPQKLAVLAAACSYAVAGALGRYVLGKGTPPLAVATGQVTVSSLVLLPLAVLIENPLATVAQAPMSAAIAVGALGLLSTAFAYMIFFHLLATVGAARVSLVTFLVPVTAILLGILFLGETIGPTQAMGMGLIAVGLVAIDGRLFARRTVSGVAD